MVFEISSQNIIMVDFEEIPEEERKAFEERLRAAEEARKAAEEARKAKELEDFMACYSKYRWGVVF